MVDRVQQVRDLLIEQYKDKPNVTGFIDSFSTELQTVDDETNNLLNNRSLTTAVGANLDVIGKIVVLDRPFTDPDPDEVFTFDNPSSAGAGYADEENSVQGGYWIGLDPIDNQQYSDTAYRFILRAKIIYNTTTATIEDMHKYASFVFDAESQVNERVGVIDLHIARPIGRQEQQILQETFPLPAGVRLGDISYSIEDGAFGFTGDDRNGGFGDLDDAGVGGVFSVVIVD